jgi:acyl-coenzyme A synthetase/AMP-(fatty) acid ligase
MDGQPLPAHRNVGKYVLERAAVYADRVAIEVTERDRQITFQDLRERALRCAVELQKRGVRRGSRVVLATKYPTNSFSIMIAVSLLGATWLKSSRSLGRGGLNLTHILIDTEDKVLLKDRRTIPVTAEFRKPPEGDLEALLESFPLHASGSDLAVFGESSGTTGEAKLIPMTYDVRWERAVAERDYEVFDTIISANQFPMSSVGASTTDLRYLANGGTVVLGGNYRDWRQHGVNIVTASPSHVVSRVFSVEPPSAESRIPRLSVRGSKTSQQFLERALTYFDDIVVGYGATEVGGICNQTINRENLEEELEKLGEPSPYATIEVVDENDQPVPANTAGLVRVRSNSMVKEYFREPEATARAFRDGWFYPGDLGELSDDGQLMIAGRANDQFNLAGIKVGAAVVDEAVQGVPGVKTAMAFLERDDTGIDILSALVVPHDAVDEDALVSQIITDLTERLGKSRTPRRIYAAAELPLNDNGKPVRMQATNSVDQYRRLL